MRELVDFVGQTRTYFSVMARSAAFDLDLHRFYDVGDPTPFPVAPTNIKFYNCTCAPLGEKSQQNKASGLSLWNPLIIRSRFIPEVLCKIVNFLNNTLALMYDRTYASTSLDGTPYTFMHYLICPVDIYDVVVLQSEYNKIGSLDCNFKVAGEGSDKFCVDMDGESSNKCLVDTNAGFNELYEMFDEGLGEAYAMQHVLRKFAADLKNPLSERVSAAYLSVWIGSNDYQVPQVVETAPWAANFIVNCFHMYGSDVTERYLIEWYGVAQFSFKQLQSKAPSLHVPELPSCTN